MVFYEKRDWESVGNPLTSIKIKWKSYLVYSFEYFNISNEQNLIKLFELFVYHLIGMLFLFSMWNPL